MFEGWFHVSEAVRVARLKLFAELGLPGSTTVAPRMHDVGDDVAHIFRASVFPSLLVFWMPFQRLSNC